MGACPANGTTGAQGGWAFTFRPGPEGAVSGVLEQKGPDNEFHEATNNRAELRAAIAALEFRVWWGEGWERGGIRCLGRCACLIVDSWDSRREWT
jgi:ribonuclease HI